MSRHSQIWGFLMVLSLLSLLGFASDIASAAAELFCVADCETECDTALKRAYSCYDRGFREKKCIEIDGLQYKFETECETVCDVSCQVW